MKYYPPTKRTRGKCQGPPVCAVQAENMSMIVGRFLTLPLRSQSKEGNW